MKETRQCQAFAEVDVCDICGRIVVTQVTIGQEEFDPRSRCSGFSYAAVWQGHPRYHREVCGVCLKQRRHVAAGFPMLVDGAVRVESWKHGLERVGSPADEDWWDRHTAYALVLGSGERALLLGRTQSYFRPLLAGDALGYMMSTELVDGGTPQVLCEPRTPTPWATCYRLSGPNWLAVDHVRARYGSECAERMLQCDGEFFEALEVKLTSVAVPKR